LFQSLEQMQNVEDAFMRCSDLAFILILIASAQVNEAVSSEMYGATLTPEMPAGAVIVPASDGALAAAVNSHGTSTTFFLKAGLHTGNSEIRPKAGSAFVGEAGAILDGGNTARHCLIHDVGVIPYAASAPRYVVTLRNLVIRGYVPPDQECAVMAADTGQGWQSVLTDPGDRNGWLFDHCTFTENRAGGLFLGSASTAQNCLASNNGQIGYKATGHNVQLLACRATGNNANRRFNYFVEAGGTKFWNVKDLLVEGGEYDGNGGMGLWFDYVWDGNVVHRAEVHDNLRAGVSVEMAVGVEVTDCRLSHNDIDGIAGSIPGAFRPWEKSPKSGPDLWTGEIFLFNACGSGTFVHPTTKASYSFAGKTWIHANHISRGHGGIMALYQGRGSIDALGAQMQGSQNGPVSGLDGIVVEDNNVACIAGYAGGVNTLVNRDYADGAGSWGPIPAAEARAQYRAIIFRRNRYSGTLKFSVPKAATLGDSDNVWDWNDRVDVDLPKWQSLGHNAPDAQTR